MSNLIFFTLGLILGGSISFVLCALFVGSNMHKTTEEQRLDDEEQIEFLERLRETKKMNKQRKALDRIKFGKEWR